MTLEITDDHVAQIIEAIREHTDFNQPKWMTTKQVSKYTGIATRTLEEYRRKGIGPKVSKRHGHVRYNRDEVDRWLT